jgi:hypothetical protein
MAHSTAGRGFFRNVNSALLMLDDETLKSHGYSREELKRRAGATYMF